MIVFYSVFFVELIGFILLEYLNKSNYSKKILTFKILTVFVTILYPIIIYGMRAVEVGTDTQNYNEIFNLIGKDLFSKKIFSYEMLYCILSVIINFFFGDFNVFLLVVGFIVFFSVYISLMQLSEAPLISMVIYVGLGLYAQSFNAIRQYLAISFILLGLIFLIKKNKNLLFILFVIIAMLFHKTAIVAIILLPLKYVKFNFKTILVFSCCVLSGIFLFPYLAQLFDKIMGTSYYLTYRNFDVENFSKSNIIFACGVLIAFICAIYFRPRIKKTNAASLKNYDFYLLMLFIFVLIKIASLFTIELIDRFGLYFLFSVLFIVPIIFNSLEKKQKIILFVVLVIVMLIFMYVSLSVMGMFEVVPYKFV